jgi:serine/threonine protein kinase
MNRTATASRIDATYDELPPSADSQADYEILRPLGVGGMATVYLARRKDTGRARRVAIKKLHDFIAEDPVNVAILHDEARLVSCIKHPNVVAILDVLETADGSSPALVMEWVEGVNLVALNAAVAKSGQRLPVDVAVAIARDVLAGLHAAHEARRDDGFALEIVHRDVSPQNILVGFDGIARLTDFGIAKATWRQQHTEVGSIKGKLGYMAPEQLEGKGDRRADLYGAAAVLWELLTGTRFRSADGEGAQVLVQILHGLAVAPSVHQADLAVLDDLLLTSLAKNPDDRFATCEEFAAELVARVAPASFQRVAEVLGELIGESPDVEALPSSQAPADWHQHTIRDVALPAPFPVREVHDQSGEFDCFADFDLDSDFTPRWPACGRTSMTVPKGHGQIGELPPMRLPPPHLPSIGTPDKRSGCRPIFVDPKRRASR